MTKIGKKKLLLVGFTLLLFGMGVGLVIAFKQGDQEHNVPTDSGTSASTDKDSQSNEQPATTRSGQKTGSNLSESHDDSSESAPSKPSGAFVSNHHANLDGRPNSNYLNSICRTTIGATCVIRFSNGNTTRELSAKTVGENGTVGWDWKLQDTGLSEGDWKIEAIATLNHKSTVTTDPLRLKVER